MKHIKYKKIFETEDSLKKLSNKFETVKDICLELEDKGFIVVYRGSDPGQHKQIHLKSIVIDRMENRDGMLYTGRFKYSDIQEVVDRLFDYLTDDIISVTVQTTRDSSGIVKTLRFINQVSRDNNGYIPDDFFENEDIRKVNITINEIH